MAAIAYPQRGTRPNRPHLTLVPPRHGPGRRTAYRRRRLLALAALVVVAVAVQLAAQLAVHTASSWLGGGSLAAPEPAAAVAAAPARSVYVVQPGDTLWTLARRAQPTGDLRPLVGRLAAAQGDQSLRAGQRIVLP
jgi:hypothetical protein